ncbi:hypothetical protein GM51_14205, partial [freshwater metagenome]
YPVFAITFPLAMADFPWNLYLKVPVSPAIGIHSVKTPSPFSALATFTISSARSLEFTLFSFDNPEASRITNGFQQYFPRDQLP